MKSLLSEKPEVKLTKAFSTPYDNAVATARTCYSSKLIFDEDVSKTPKARLLRDKIASSTYVAGHHTTLQHAHFQFAIKNISRHSLWSFFHAHPFYNSEQVSQRYVAVDKTKFLIPNFEDEDLLSIYLSCINEQQKAYDEMTSLLHEPCEKIYFSIYKGRQKNAQDPRWQGTIKKRCQEVARYILPVATHAHFYHTISGLTLHRYHRIAESFDCPYEQKIVIDEMVREVNKIDPLFFQNIEDSLPLEKTLEYQIINNLSLEQINSKNASGFAKDFDANLEQKTSKLIAHTANPEEMIGNLVRQILCLSHDALSNEKAVSLLLSPSSNNYVGESLNLVSLSKICKALDMVHFTFIKKISHSADSQAQRHRMLSAVRPLFSRTINLEESDYITPAILKNELALKAKNVFDRTQEKTLETMRLLHQKGVSAEKLQYLATNAHPIRYTETGSLMDFLHKWTTRLCYNAQEEIWQNSKDEVLEINAKFPQIGKFLLAPCGLRKLSGHTPVCPEGDRFCGTQVWKKSVQDYEREF